MTAPKTTRNHYDGMQLAKPIRLTIADAACRQYPGMEELWFSDNEFDQVRAKRICNGSWLDNIDPCPLREACLEAAIDNDIRWGIWGGTNRNTRHEIRKKQAKLRAKQ